MQLKIFRLFSGVLLLSGFLIKQGNANEDYDAFLKDALEDDPTDVDVVPLEAPEEDYMWTASEGGDWTWNGGPPLNSNMSSEGEYYVFDSSQFIRQKMYFRPESAILPLKKEERSTSMSGECLAFWYNTKGSALRRPRLVLKTFFQDPRNADDGNSTEEVTHESDIWTAPENTFGEWMPVTVTFSSRNDFQFFFEVERNTFLDLEKHRAYVAIDNVQTWTKPCPGSCKFTTGTCSWTVEADESATWRVGRQTESALTGPMLDYSSSQHMEVDGGYLYLDTDYPTKPGESSRLVSIELPPPQIPNVPYCLSFKTLLYGTVDFGYLSVLMQTEEMQDDNSTETKERVVWSYGGFQYTPEFTRRWLNVEVPVVWEEENFKIIIQGTSGAQARSNIGLDSVSLAQMPCSLMPDVGLSDIPVLMDCSFGGGTCSWKAGTGGMWEYMRGGSSYRPIGHTNPDRSVHLRDSYVGVDLANYRYKEGQWSALSSVDIVPVYETFCMSFWYYMYSETPMYPVLGGLRVILEEKAVNSRNTTVWALDNHQGKEWMLAYTTFQTTARKVSVHFEVVKGSKQREEGIIAIDDISVYSRQCSVVPERATRGSLDCDFYSSLCHWEVRNQNADREDEVYNFRLANDKNHLPFERDHTFQVLGSGYVFIDSVGDEKTSYLLYEDDNQEEKAGGFNCLSFWFKPYRHDRGASLSVGWEIPNQLQQYTTVWLFPDNKAALQQQPKTNVEWTYAQVQIPMKERITIRFVATVQRTGFMLDDIKYERDAEFCPTRPASSEYTNP